MLSDSVSIRFCNKNATLQLARKLIIAWIWVHRIVKAIRHLQTVNLGVLEVGLAKHSIIFLYPQLKSYLIHDDKDPYLLKWHSMFCNFLHH